MREVVSARPGNAKLLGRPAPSPWPGHALITCGDNAVGEQLVQVAAHRRGREVQAFGKFGRRGRTDIQYCVRHSLTRRCLVCRRIPGDPGTLETFQFLAVSLAVCATAECLGTGLGVRAPDL